ncbi:uncharacterized protein LOC135119520 [Zophobas morio]|uniref:uncharacterized protein LOC135119520 n=1 Tax=Zophobas morio TaxID=2755281 RepID=UPI003083D8A8
MLRFAWLYLCFATCIFFPSSTWDKYSYSDLARLKVPASLNYTQIYLTNFSNQSYNFQPQENTILEFREAVEVSRLLLDLFCYAYPVVGINQTDTYEVVRAILNHLHRALGDYKDTPKLAIFSPEDIKRERSWIALNASYLASLLQEEKIVEYFASPQNYFYERKKLSKNVWGNPDISRDLPNSRYTGYGNIALFVKELSSSLIKRWNRLTSSDVPILLDEIKKFYELHQFRKLLRIQRHVFTEFPLIVKERDLLRVYTILWESFYKRLTDVKEKYEQYWSYKKKNTSKSESYKAEAEKAWTFMIKNDKEKRKQDFENLMINISLCFIKAKYYRFGISIWTYIILSFAFMAFLLAFGAIASYIFHRRYVRMNGYQAIPSHF